MDLVTIMIVRKRTSFQSLRHKNIYEIPSRPNLLILWRISPNLILMHYYILDILSHPIR